MLRIRDEEEGSLVLPAPVAAEVDYLLGVRFGEAARRAFLSDLAAQRYEVACLEPGDYRTVADLDARYADLGLGLAGCSVVVLAERYGTRRLLNFDERNLPDSRQRPSDRFRPSRRRTTRAALAASSRSLTFTARRPSRRNLALARLPSAAACRTTCRCACARRIR